MSKLYPAPLSLDDGEGSTPDSVFALITGESAGYFATVGWRRKHRTQPGALQGPFVVQVKLTDPWDGRDDDELALIWDGHVVGTVVSAPQGSTTLFTIDEVQGEVLEIWAQGKSQLGFDVATGAGYEISIHPIEQEATLREAATAENAQKSADPIIDRVLASANTLTGALVLAVVVVGGIYLVKK